MEAYGIHISEFHFNRRINREKGKDKETGSLSLNISIILNKSLLKLD